MSIVEILSYAFLQRALIAGIFIAASCAALGLFLVLRRFSMIGDGLAHIALATVALALVLGLMPLVLSLPLTALASLLILALSEKTSMYGDTAIAMLSALAASVAIILASVGKGFSVDLVSYLFGSILSITNTEVVFSVILSILVLLFVGVLYSKLFITSYDSDYAKVQGVKTRTVNSLLVIMTSFTVSLGLRVVGSMLVSSLIVFPAVSALQLGRSFKATIVIALFSGVLSVVVGILFSFILNWPTGATIVVVNFIWFLIAFMISRTFGVIK